jgi:mannosyltransferase OCH1-like enzyme
MIPKMVHCCWFSGEEKPDILKKYRESWDIQLKNYQIKEWTTADFNPNLCNFSSQAYNKKKWAFVADYFRLWVLYNYGGIYLDSDILLHQNFDKYLSDRVFMSWETFDLLGAHVMGAEKGHPLIKKYLDHYQNLNFMDNQGNCNMTPIPRIITPLTIRAINLRGGLTQKYKNGTVIYPMNIFTINNDDGMNVAEHLFISSWKDELDCNYLEDRLKLYYNKYSGIMGRIKYCYEKLVKKFKK